MKQNAKAIAKELVKEFRELEKSGELARMGEVVGKAIAKLFKETRSHQRLFDRKYGSIRAY